MHARTLTAVYPIRSRLDSASLLRVRFGRSLSVWVGVSRVWDAVGGVLFGVFVLVRKKLSLQGISVDGVERIVVRPLGKGVCRN